MKKIKFLLLILTLFSLEAGATGYAHNMFVAHRKLQAGKECVVEKIASKKSKPSAKPTKQVVQVKASFINTHLTNQMSNAVTLNQRVLEEGPASFFGSEKNEDNDESVVAKLVTIVRCVVYAFIGSPQLHNS
ncbi:hypothetical protein [Dyadobacter arcticus]|uniref:Menaquinone-dependent protoporphyrinogen IX oxidase n=1 Tax=Dyadobacter arcticus TaxID=1078754 RepID=A0ABX0USV7_9BACT|nr:hypothetical protein [Dyadobacter arcticus]NIJ56057.1 menaquinone-dependent protoporphyrinogen IX oxidase [Dyadobacter arcticus]